jgi:Periplasmic copper-binding protein (NosD)
MRSTFHRALFAGVAAAVLAIGVSAASATAASDSALYVSPSGSSGAPDKSCGSAAFATIGDAVAAASGGDTIVVCPGTYRESVTVTGKSLQLVSRSATIDASGLPEGIVLMGPETAGSSVSGFTIVNARAEGLYADGTSNLTIDHNRIVGNDLACQPQTGDNDCGEGLHLDAVADSQITGNYVAHNTGGILLTDGVPAGSTGEFAFGFTTQFSGPASGNLISGNTVEDNLWDCGITMPSHNDGSKGANGVFDNTVSHNISTGNGTADGDGAGILVATPFPGTASYDNLIEFNQVSGNGLAGVTIHSHAPGQNVSGNQILDNRIGTNALGPPPGDQPGDGDFGVSGTIGILVGSAVVDVNDTVISGNVVQNNDTAIWTTSNVTGDFTDNHFAHDGATVVAG